MTPLLFAAFQTLNPNGMIGSSWRDPSNAKVDFLTLGFWTRLGRRLEEGGFDFLFLADSTGYPTIDGEVMPFAIEAAITVPTADPVTVAAAIGGATSSLGIVVTSSTVTERPAAFARRYATLDHLTDGRIGWNIVSGGAQTAASVRFSEDLIPHDERYVLAKDYLEICLRLWEGSWADDALRLDQEAGMYADPQKVQQISYEGPYLKSRGILTVPPSPQRTPLLLQAGTSAAGQDFAAQYAEGVFIGGGGPKLIRLHIESIREQAGRYDRPRDAIKFFVGASFFVAETAEAAERKREKIMAFATIGHAAAAFAWSSGVDLLAYDLDAPLPDIHNEEGQTSVQRFRSTDGRPDPTVREILENLRSSGINDTMFVGTPESIADQIEEFVALTGVDGFLIQPHLSPATDDDFIDLLRPTFVARGLMKPAQAGGTLRHQLFGDGPRLPGTHRGAQLSFNRIQRMEDPMEIPPSISSTTPEM